MPPRSFGPDVLPLTDDSPGVAVRQPADPTERENVRVWKREAFKRELDEARVAECHLAEINAAIAKCNQRKDDAAAKHVNACHPIQTRLNELEQQQIRAIRNRKELDPNVEGERAKLLGQLQQLNETLAREVESQDRLIKQLDADRVRFAQQSGGTVLVPTQLAQTASEPLRVRLKVAQNTQTWATRRYEMAREAHQRSPGPFSAAELETAQRLLDEADRAVSVAFEACLDE